MVEGGAVEKRVWSGSEVWFCCVVVVFFIVIIVIIVDDLCTRFGSLFLSWIGFLIHPVSAEVDSEDLFVVVKA